MGFTNQQTYVKITLDDRLSPIQSPFLVDKVPCNQQQTQLLGPTWYSHLQLSICILIYNHIDNIGVTIPYNYLISYPYYQGYFSIFPYRQRLSMIIPHSLLSRMGVSIMWGSSVISWFVNPMNSIGESVINHTCWTYVHQLSYRKRVLHILYLYIIP